MSGVPLVWKEPDRLYGRTACMDIRTACMEGVKSGKKIAVMRWRLAKRRASVGCNRAVPRMALWSEGTQPGVPRALWRHDVPPAR